MPNSSPFRYLLWVYILFLAYYEVTLTAGWWKGMVQTSDFQTQSALVLGNIAALLVPSWKAAMQSGTVDVQGEEVTVTETGDSAGITDGVDGGRG